MQGTELDKFSTKKFSTTKQFSMLTLMKEKKPVVSVKSEFENREKLKIKAFL